jgi:hypothetical protein
MQSFAETQKQIGEAVMLLYWKPDNAENSGIKKNGKIIIPTAIKFALL